VAIGLSAQINTDPPIEFKRLAAQLSRAADERLKVNFQEGARNSDGFASSVLAVRRLRI